MNLDLTARQTTRIPVEDTGILSLLTGAYDSMLAPPDNPALWSGEDGSSAHPASQPGWSELKHK